MTENAVVKEVLTCLAHNHWVVIEPRTTAKAGVELILNRALTQNTAGLAWRNNSGAVKMGRSFVKFGLSGSPDIIGIAMGGLFCGWECKQGKGDVSKVQIAFHGLVNLLGGKCFVVRGYEDVSDSLREIHNETRHTLLVDGS